ncbi:MAG: hypothetical protein COA33_003730 [Fluviicola sp.]|nr:hypothetical protein [Fluviicola sp.]
MKFFLIIVLSSLFFSCSVSRMLESTELKDYPAPSKDWTEGNCPCEEVSFYLMEEKEPPAWFNIEGEDIFKLSGKIDSIDEIPQNVVVKIQNRVKKVNGCVVFIDLRDYYGSEMFPKREKDEVYFYWGKCK